MPERSARVLARPLFEDAVDQPTPVAEDAAVTIIPLARRARFSLRIDPLLLVRASPKGFAADLAVNRCAVEHGRITMRLGPNEWQVSGPENQSNSIVGDLQAALAKLHYALVDLSHARSTFFVSGPSAANTINAGCPLDLSPASFPAGTATRTLLGKAEIVVCRLGEAAAFEIECGRSHAPYVRAFLIEAARQYRWEE